MREALFETADDFVATGTFDATYVRGYGIIDTLRALRADCNDNGANDQDEIDGGYSQDCNENGIPDECERDCNGNGMVDSCEVGIAFVDRSPQFSPFYYRREWSQAYVINSLPEAASDVVLSFFASANLGSYSESVTVTLNDRSVSGGTLYQLGAFNCSDPPDMAEIILTPARFNDIIDAAGGRLTIKMRPSDGVETTPCGLNSYIAVNVDYDTPAESPDCNRNLIPDSCDAPGDLDGDGLVSLSDHASAVSCRTAPCLDPPCDPALYADPCCVLADFDLDGDFDLKDFASIQLEMIGR
jgi:hypothetical protein